MKRFKLTVNGRVQGVGFRVFATTKATTLKLTGFCKNLTNGDVYVEVQGPIDSIEKFITYIENGNRFIKVSNITKSEIQIENSESKFKMEY